MPHAMPHGGRSPKCLLPLRDEAPANGASDAAFAVSMKEMCLFHNALGYDNFKKFSTNVKDGKESAKFKIEVKKEPVEKTKAEEAKNEEKRLNAEYDGTAEIKGEVQKVTEDSTPRVEKATGADTVLPQSKEGTPLPQSKDGTSSPQKSTPISTSAQSSGSSSSSADEDEDP